MDRRTKAQNFSMTTHKWSRIKVMDSGKVVNGSEVTTVIRQVLEKAAARLILEVSHLTP